jgi:lipopolysaccharide export LptBFGC system permease protein LptF
MTLEQWTDDKLDKLAETTKENADAIRENANAIRELREEAKEQGIRFTYYQQASQWVVNLAFGLLATATITTIVTAVYRR